MKGSKDPTADGVQDPLLPVLKLAEALFYSHIVLIHSERTMTGVLFTASFLNCEKSRALNDALCGFCVVISAE